MANHSVLVVEDDHDIRDALRDLLETEGYQVHAAANGREALDLLESSCSPALVLLDLMMPVLNGWQFLELLRADPRHAGLPVVIVSAQPAALSGANAVLRKPFSLDVVLDIVQRYCGRVNATACAL